jgi:hypothetical protein
MRKLVILIFAWLCLLTVSEAQDVEGYFTLGPDINLPLSNRSWVSSPGVGAKLGFQRFINERWSAGADFNWGTYSKYIPTDTYYQSNGAITTDYFKYVYAYGLVVSGRYHFPMANKHFLPFVGLGLGAANNKYTIYYNRYSDQNKSYGFLARPEGGVLIRFSERRSIGAMVGLHYEISTTKSKDQGYSNFSNVGVTISLMAVDR